MNAIFLREDLEGTFTVLFNSADEGVGDADVQRSRFACDDVNEVMVFLLHRSATGIKQVLRFAQDDKVLMAAGGYPFAMVAFPVVGAISARSRDVRPGCRGWVVCGGSRSGVERRRSR